MVKIRNGFVSNSSSASFVIKKAGLTEAQIDAIKRHGEYSKIIDKHYKQMAEELIAAGFDLSDLDYRLQNLLQDYNRISYFGYQDVWNIKETNDEIYLGCIVDNFDMEEFLKFIEVPVELIQYHPDTDLTWYISKKENECKES